MTQRASMHSIRQDPGLNSAIIYFVVFDVSKCLMSKSLRLPTASVSAEIQTKAHEGQTAVAFVIICYRCILASNTNHVNCSNHDGCTIQPLRIHHPIHQIIWKTNISVNLYTLVTCKGWSAECAYDVWESETMSKSSTAGHIIPTIVTFLPKQQIIMCFLWFFITSTVASFSCWVTNQIGQTDPLFVMMNELTVPHVELSAALSGSLLSKLFRCELSVPIDRTLLTPLQH